MIQVNIWEGRIYPLLNWQEDQHFICLYATQVGWGGCGLIHMRMLLITPGCCLATTLQQPVCSCGMVDGAVGDLETHPYQPLWGALIVFRVRASCQGKTCSWPFHHEKQSLLSTGEQGENLWDVSLALLFVLPSHMPCDLQSLDRAPVTLSDQRDVSGCTSYFHLPDIELICSIQVCGVLCLYQTAWNALFQMCKLVLFYDHLPPVVNVDWDFTMCFCLRLWEVKKLCSDLHPNPGGNLVFLHILGFVTHLLNPPTD